LNMDNSDSAPGAGVPAGNQKFRNRPAPGKGADKGKIIRLSLKDLKRSKDSRVGANKPLYDLKERTRIIDGPVQP
jgi:hypothetical protein